VTVPQPHAATASATTHPCRVRGAIRTAGMMASRFEPHNLYNRLPDALSYADRVTNVAPVLAPGTTLNRYVVETPIGSGGMGAVYRARDTHLDRAVALKVLSDGIGGIPDKEARERLVREARAAAALSHPNAVSIYDAGDSEHGPFIVMELVEGETLRGAMARGVTPAQVVSWMKMAALALGEAHERGIVHRDIKPENSDPTASPRCSTSASPVRHPKRKIRASRRTRRSPR